MRVDIFKWFWIMVVLVNTVAKPQKLDHHETHLQILPRIQREVASGYRLGCNIGDTQPLSRVNTTEKLNKLRSLFISAVHNTESVNIKAYIIPTNDAHASEFIADHDRRRDFISGFTGSAGTAVVTLTEAALWTDGRYFLQADQQMDCNWLLMKQGQPGVPSIVDWLKTVLSTGDTVGADPKLLDAETWLEYTTKLGEFGVILKPIPNNLVDQVWDIQPPYASEPIFIHELEFAGRSWQKKLGDIREQLVKKNADAIVITALDEVAWALNIRGRDIPYNPVFRSFLVIDSKRAVLFTPTEKVTNSVITHLNTRNCETAVCVGVEDYEAINTVLRSMADNWEHVIIPRKIAYSGGASFWIYQLVPESKILLLVSPLVYLKARKNPTEVKGMKRAHIKDAVALCDFLAKLETEVKEGLYWDEIKASKVLEKYRSEQALNQGPSFGTIAGFGSNSAIIHYEPSTTTNKAITRNGTFLLDSGGQYLDGTTDVTRTLHYGMPTKWQKETYTRVLMGHINLGLLTFPEGKTDKDIDILARAPLYEAGLNYRHGTGHGIGAFLNVHESPVQVRDEGNERNSLEENYCFSDEPGYYEERNFGMRLENIVRVVKKNTTKQWLNEYNSRIRLEIGEELKKQGRMDGFQWMMSKTQFIPEDSRSL
ncbi:xaa-Pro aminopeptidase ApepP-like isoform X2 [Artemia franciscana]|uniref:xaa-Pro aminopeptidase ApepP-like isoform X2 n=1 Tax=Artemia franciscana TaxID=6661 RepID=UPI0032DA3270